MFDRLKKIFGRAEPVAPASQLSRQETAQVSEWAQKHGLTCTDAMAPAGQARREGQVFTLNGRVKGKPWRLECGVPSRDFIPGQELRGRSDLGVLGSVSVVLMNAPLKAVLEKRAYSLYTDSLQTAIDPKLPEEMRWLAIYPEIKLPDLPHMFFDRYALLAARREHAAAWMSPALSQALMSWPPSGPSSEVPFVMTLLRGKCTFRMAYPLIDLPTLQHVAHVYKLACEAALTRVAQNVEMNND